MVMDSNTLEFMFVKQGKQGEDGKILYTWVKYAQDQNGTGMTDNSTDAVYIGIAYNKESPEESNDPKDYQWTKILGDDGEQGEKGDKGDQGDKGKDGTDAYTIVLSNENISFSTNSQRYTVNNQTFQSDVIVYNGASIITDFFINITNNESAITVTKNNHSISISVKSNQQLSTLSGQVNIEILTGELTFSKILTWTCALQGTNGKQGEDAKSISIIPSSNVFKSTDGGQTFSPNTITVTPALQNLSFGKWQYSINGGSSFSDISTTQNGLSVSNNILSISKSCNLFTDNVTSIVFKAISSDANFYDTATVTRLYDVIDAGDGRNLLLNTSKYRESTPLERSGLKKDDYSVYNNIITSIELEANKNYTLQAKTDGNWMTNHDTSGSSPADKKIGLWLVSDNTNTFLDMSKGYAVFTPSVTTKYKLRVNQYSNGTDSYTIKLWDIKLERGSSATGWSAAPEDINSRFDENESDLADISESLKGTSKTVTELKNVVDEQAKTIESKVSQDTYTTDLNVIKNQMANSNEGLNKWLVSAYQKSMFSSDYQDKAVMEMFCSKENIVAAQTLLYEDANLKDGLTFSVSNDTLVFYGLTFVYFNKSVRWTTTATFKDKYNIYVNGSAISSAGTAGSNTVVMTFQEGWNSIEVIINSSNNVCSYYFASTLSSYDQCKKMNCYEGTITGRDTLIQSKTSQLLVSLSGINTKVSEVETGVKNNGEQVQELSNKYSELEQTSESFRTEVSKTYAKRDDFSTIGARNLIRNSNTLIFDDYSFGGTATTDVALTDANGDTLQDKDGNTLTATENYTKNYTGKEIDNMITEVIS